MISFSLLFSLRDYIHPCFSYVHDTLLLYVTFLGGLGLDCFDTHMGWTDELDGLDT